MECHRRIENQLPTLFEKTKVMKPIVRMVLKTLQV